MNKRIALVGDSTTTGGKIISGKDNLAWNNVATALVGDKAFCPKCQSTGTIIEGTKCLIIQGKPVAYDGCIIQCGCAPIGIHRIIALKSTVFIEVY